MGSGEGKSITYAESVYQAHAMAENRYSDEYGCPEALPHCWEGKILINEIY